MNLQRCFYIIFLHLYVMLLTMPLMLHASVTEELIGLQCAPISQRTWDSEVPSLQERYKGIHAYTSGAKLSYNVTALAKSNQALCASFFMFYHAGLRSAARRENPFKTKLASVIYSAAPLLPHAVSEIISSYCDGFTLEEQLWQELDAYQENKENSSKLYEISAKLQLFHYVGNEYIKWLDTRIDAWHSKAGQMLPKKKNFLTGTMDAIRLPREMMVTNNEQISIRKLLTNIELVR